MSVQLRIGPKLMLALAGLLAATVMVSGVAVAGLGAVDAQTQELYHHNILTTQAIAELQATLDDAAGSALQLLLFEGAAERSRLLADLRGRIVPRVDERIAALQKSYAADPDADPARLERLSEGWGAVKRLIRSGLDPHDEAQKQAMTRQVVAAVDRVSTLVAEMAATEVEHARESREGAEATYRATRWRVLGIAAAAVLVWLAISLLLIRNLVPRVRSYSAFAAGVADGQPDGQLTVRGADELAELGHTLNAMVRRRRQERRYEETQAEFADTMQLSETEPEAHQLLKHHLERSIDGSQVTVLNRNNSADRLEAATPVAPECPPADEAHRRIRESVTQAAPVLANLRNLAIAEIWAATDALTGLPNNRAVQDTIKRMVAQAGRNLSPLSAALLDLDHFKRINDAYGHSRGDEVSPPSPPCCARRCVRATSSAATAARSSSCCCRTPGATRRWWSPRR